MTFSDNLKTCLQHIAQDCYDFIPPTKVRRSDQVATLTVRPTANGDFHFYSPGLMFGSDKSNHRKIAEKGFKTEREQDCQALQAMIADAIPAIATPMMGFSLEIREPSKTKAARFRFEICSHQLASSPVQLATLVKKIDRIRRHLEDVPLSEARSFKIGERIIQARDAYDALRIHIALNNPDIIDNPPTTFPSIEVTEVLDSKPPLSGAVFRGLDAQTGDIP